MLPWRRINICHKWLARLHQASEPEKISSQLNSPHTHRLAKTGQTQPWNFEIVQLRFVHNVMKVRVFRAESAKSPCQWTQWSFVRAHNTDKHGGKPGERFCFYLSSKLNPHCYWWLPLPVIKSLWQFDSTQIVFWIRWLQMTEWLHL